MPCDVLGASIEMQTATYACYNVVHRRAARRRVKIVELSP